MEVWGPARANQIQPPASPSQPTDQPTNQPTPSRSRAEFKQRMEMWGLLRLGLSAARVALSKSGINKIAARSFMGGCGRGGVWGMRAGAMRAEPCWAWVRLRSRVHRVGRGGWREGGVGSFGAQRGARRAAQAGHHIMYMYHV
jgi:hypothetical protein